MPARRPHARKPVVLFCDLRRPSDEIINISSQNGAEGVVTQMLPKSHISHVILNANVSEERFLDMKVTTENKMQRKSRDVHDHVINTFLKRLERKQNRWIKEDNYVYKNFNVTSSRRPVSVDFADGYPEHLLATPPTASQYHPAKYPYSAITRKPISSTEQTGNKLPKRSQTAMNLNTQSSLPQIPTAKESANPAANKEPQNETHPVKLPSAPRGIFSNRTNGTTNAPGRTISDGWQSRATTIHRSKRKVAFKPQDERFETLMLYLSPVLDRQSLRRSDDIFSRMTSPMSKQSSRSRMLSYRS